MENRFSRLSALGLIAALAALLLALCALACPATAMADEAKQVAHSYDFYGRMTTYDTIDKAMEFAGEDAIIMDTDWDLGANSLAIPTGKTRTIDMNGHRITSSAIGTINVGGGASLKLTSNAEYVDFSYRGYGKTGGGLTDQTWGWKDGLTVNAGGLVTNAREEWGTGITVSEGGKLQLEDVAVAGCSYCGIRINGVATGDLTNTVVCHNSAGTGPDSSFGAGVYFSSYRITLNMTNSHIDDNYAYNNGGGVYCVAEGLTIRSNDGTGTIEGNASLRESSTAFSRSPLRAPFPAW